MKDNATASIVLKKLINQIDIVTCPSETAEVLMDVTTLINIISIVFLRDYDVASKLQEKQTLQETEWSKALASIDKAEKLGHDFKNAKKEFDTNVCSISFWKDQIKELVI